MIYSYKNFKLTLNGKEFLASSAELGETAELTPSRIIGKSNTDRYAPGGVGGSLRVNYLLSGSDPLKDFIYNERTPISGNFGGLIFETGYLRSYSVSIQPNSAASVSADILFFDDIKGVFSPTTARLDSGNVLNSAWANIDSFDYQETLNVYSFNLSANFDVKPSFLIENSINSNLPAYRVSFGPKEISAEIQVDSLIGRLPISGERGGVRVTLNDPYNKNNSEYFEISGLIYQRSFSSTSSDVLKNTISIRNTFDGQRPIINSFSPTSGPVGTKVNINGYGMDAVISVSMGGKPCQFSIYDSSNLIVTIPQDAVSSKITISNGIDSAETSQFSVSYVAPASITFSPKYASQGSYIDIEASDVYNTTHVYFGDETGSFEVISPTLIRATIPTVAKSSRLRIASTITQLTGQSNEELVVSPVITGWGPISGIYNDVINLYGYNFTGITGVTFNGVVGNFTIVNTGYMTVPVPSGYTRGTIQIVNASGLNYNINSFQPIAKLTAVDPASGITGSTLRITGINFDPEILEQISFLPSGYFKVSIGGAITGFWRVSDTLLTGIVPNNAASGPVFVYCRNGADVFPISGNFKVNYGGPEIFYYGAPTMTSGLKNTLTIKGKNFFNITEFKLISNTGLSSGSIINIPSSNYFTDGNGIIVTVTGLSLSGYQTGYYDLLIANNIGGIYSGNAISILKQANKALAKPVIVANSGDQKSGYRVNDGLTTDNYSAVSHGSLSFSGDYANYFDITFKNRILVNQVKYVRPEGFPLNNFGVILICPTGKTASGLSSETNRPTGFLDFYPPIKDISGVRFAVKDSTQDLYLNEIEIY